MPDHRKAIGSSASCYLERMRYVKMLADRCPDGRWTAMFTRGLYGRSFQLIDRRVGLYGTMRAEPNSISCENSDAYHRHAVEIPAVVIPVEFKGDYPGPGLCALYKKDEAGNTPNYIGARINISTPVGNARKLHEKRREFITEIAHFRYVDSTSTCT